jgi:hypothetical protein
VQTKRRTREQAFAVGKDAPAGQRDAREDSPAAENSRAHECLALDRPCLAQNQSTYERDAAGDPQPNFGHCRLRGHEAYANILLIPDGIR